VVLDASDYTASNGNSVVLAVGASAGDELNVRAFSTFDIANTYTQAQTDALLADVSGVRQSGSAKTGSYTLQTTDAGKHIEIGSGGSVTIPDAVFADGDVVTLFNNTTGSITVTCSITTAYISGVDSDKASVSLLTRGLCTVFFASGTVCVISGSVT
jgi:hypothetical protein